ncbi:MAG: S4 domain-containing protein [Pseudomonadota bacterium]
MSADSENNVTMRVDKWLWAARFYKTRSLAIAAINGGKVHLNASRIKPSHKVTPGDRLGIRKGPYSFNITIEKLTRQRRPAEEARTLYSEPEESANARHELYRERKLQGHSARHRERRPDKRARRQIRRFKQQ